MRDYLDDKYGPPTWQELQWRVEHELGSGARMTRAKMTELERLEGRLETAPPSGAPEAEAQYARISADVAGELEARGRYDLAGKVARRVALQGVEHGGRGDAFRFG